MRSLKLVALMATIIGFIALITFGPKDIPKIMGLSIFVATTVSAFIFVFIGEDLVARIPMIRRFHKTQQLWSILQIAGFKVPSECLLADLIQWRFEELTSPKSVTLDSVRHLRFGSVVTFLSFRDRSIRHLIRELRVYSGAFLILMLISILYSGPDRAGKTLSEIADIVLSAHFIPILEAVTIIYIIVRLATEFQSIKALLDGE